MLLSTSCQSMHSLFASKLFQPRVSSVQCRPADYTDVGPTYIPVIASFSPYAAAEDRATGPMHQGCLSHFAILLCQHFSSSNIRHIVNSQAVEEESVIMNLSEPKQT